MNLKSAFGQTLRRLRYERQLSQETLSYETGIDRSYLSELENGHKLPSLLVVFRVAEAMAMTAAALVDEVEKELKNQQRTGASSG